MHPREKILCAADNQKTKRGEILFGVVVMTKPEEDCAEDGEFLVELIVQGRKLRPVPERSLVENSGFFRNVFNKMQQQDRAAATTSEGNYPLKKDQGEEENNREFDEEEDYVVLTLNEAGNRNGGSSCSNSSSKTHEQSDPLSKISFETMSTIVEYFASSIQPCYDLQSSSSSSCHLIREGELQMTNLLIMFFFIGEAGNNIISSAQKH